MSGRCVPAAALTMAWLVASACNDSDGGAEAPTPIQAEVGLLAGLDVNVTQRPIALTEGIGVWPSELDTPVPVARIRYGQGQAFLAAFEWLAAARSFHEALKLDPGLALAEIGVARSFLGLEARTRAQEHARRAASLATRPRSDRDRQWLVLDIQQLEAIAAWDNGDRQPHADYLGALERHLATNPDDLHATILRGHAESRPDGWGQIPAMGALPWYRRALAAAPTHAGVHHFLVHCLEGLGRHAEATIHADRFAHLAPAIPHAHHMRAHIAPALGRWDEARTALQRADMLHRARFVSQTMVPREDWHFGHNLRLLAAVNQHFGDLDAAETAYREAADIGYGGRRAGFYCWLPVIFMASQGRYEEALTSARACAALPSVLARVLGTAASGEALLALGRRPEAFETLEVSRRHLAQFDASLRPVSTDRSFAHTAHTAVDILTAKLGRGHDAATVVDARLLDLAGKLCRGHSVDAWALCQLRVGELVTDAERLDRGSLAAALAQLIVRH